MSRPYQTDISLERVPLVERIDVDRGQDAPTLAIPADYVQRIVIDVIHDGRWIPEEFLVDRNGGPIELSDVQADYVRERDWGASLVAERLAQRLGLDSYCRVNVARVLMDFGRFPGSTPRFTDHLHRFAINYPFSKLLSYAQKKHLLEAYYDQVSEQMERVLRGKLIKIAIHTYDQCNESGTVRPPVSLITRSIGYQTEYEMPAGLFDPLYPDILGEFTADRVLRDRISLTLEKANIPTGHNYPYCFPEGSLEVRYQVWAFFQFLRLAFESAFPDVAHDPHYAMVWEMLLDTNLRSSESEALRSYLHMFRKAPLARRSEFQKAELAYERISEFVRNQEHDVVERYRFSPERPSSIGVEVRKDVVCELDAGGIPVRPRMNFIPQIADTIAEALAIYLNDDRSPHGPTHDLLERTDPWYTTPRD